MNVVIFFLVCLLAREAMAQKLLPPEVGAYFAGYLDFGPTASEVTAERIDDFVSIAGEKPVWAYFAQDWLDGKIEFPEESVKIIQSRNIIPYMRLMPWSEMADSARRADPIFSMKAILTGKFDDALRLWFSKAKANGGVMMAEFGPEANGDWFPWNGRWNGGAAKDQYGDPTLPDGPERFRNVFRHIVTLAREQGADNITWVFHADTAKSPDRHWNDIKYYYPGDDYVDWIGLSIFGAQLPENDWEIFSDKLKNFLPEIEALHSNRPLLVSEFAVIESGRDSAKKAKWIDNAFESVELGIFKQIKGMSYWHSPGWLPNKAADMRIDSSLQALEAFRRQVSRPFWSVPAQLQSPH